MKRAVILRGRHSVGKSTIIYDAYDWIISTYSVVNVIPPSTWKHYKTNEVLAVLQVGKLIIGIASAGDTGKIVDDYITLFTKHKCDIIIGSCRTRGSSYNVVKAKLNYPAYITDWMLPEWLSPSIATRVSIGLDIMKTRVIGLPKP